MEFGQENQVYLTQKLTLEMTDVHTFTRTRFLVQSIRKRIFSTKTQNQLLVQSLNFLYYI